MIAQQGRVVAIEGDEAVVRIGGTSGCPACDAGNGCGAGIFGRLLRNRATTVRVLDPIGARVGQAVQLGISEERFLSLVFRLYGLPLVAGLLGAALGFSIAQRIGLQGFSADLWTLVPGACSAGLALLWARRRLREFPMRAAVHLLHAAEAPSQADCRGASRQHEQDPATDEFEPFGR